MTGIVLICVDDLVGAKEVGHAILRPGHNVPPDSIQQQNLPEAADVRVSETPESPSTESCSESDEWEQAPAREVCALE